MLNNVQFEILFKVSKRYQLDNGRLLEELLVTENFLYNKYKPKFSTTLFKDSYFYNALGIINDKYKKINDLWGIKMKKQTKQIIEKLVEKPIVKKSFIDFLLFDTYVRHINLITLLFVLLGIIAMILQNRYLNSFMLGGFTGTYIAILLLSILNYKRNKELQWMNWMF